MATSRPPSASGQAPDAEWADRGFGKAAFNMRRGREGRVHQHHARPDCRIEPFVDLLGVMAGELALIGKLSC